MSEQGERYKYVCPKCKNVWHNVHPKGTPGMKTIQKCEKCGAEAMGIKQS